MIGDICHPTGLVLSKDVLFAEAVLCFEHTAGGMQQLCRMLTLRDCLVGIRASAIPLLQRTKRRR